MTEIRNITIVGAGTMGHSLAQAFAQEGYHVWLTDIREEVLVRARKLIASNLQTMVETGVLDRKRQASALPRIKTDYKC